jgi:hypothetical protein
MKEMGQKTNDFMMNASEMLGNMPDMSAIEPVMK